MRIRKLNVNLEHCYGIKKLEHELKFKHRVFAVYAPNGVMKTSFAKTMIDLSNGSEPKDIVFPDRNTVCEVTLDGNQIRSEGILVIESYREDYDFEGSSTLLASQDLKKDYDDLHKEINKTKADLIKELKQLSGLKKDDIEKEIYRAFGKGFFDVLVDFNSEIENGTISTLSRIKYKEIYDPKVVSFLGTETFKNDIEKYIEKYDELIKVSPYFNKDFKFHNAQTIQKNLSDNKFFKGGHSVNIYDGKKDTKYSKEEDVGTLFEKEKNKIFNNTKLKEIFSDINKKLSNEKLRSFRDYLLDNKEILPELSDLEELQKKLWMAYFIDQKKACKDLFDKYTSGQEKIKELVEDAKSEQTDWEEVIRIFNSRFSHHPFTLQVKNREDVILKNDVASIEFVFKDSLGEKKYSKEEKGDLLKVLSTGERRALYILNVIFNIEIRKKEDRDIIIVVDDIADSFDYKNKYAIIDYLKQISEFNKFFMIILTHNFDFLRTIEGRSIVKTHQCLMAIKSHDKIKFESFKNKTDIRNPFERWKQNLNKDLNLIASIPFVRNVIEYTEGTKDNNDYDTLTSILHIKRKTESLTISNLQEIYHKAIPQAIFPKKNGDENLVNLIFSTADQCLSEPEGINLENKIVLSIAIRLKAEQFMLKNISDEEPITSNQTSELFRRYEEEFNNELEILEVLKRVVLITPENIHLNSFMYEPILDMGDADLNKLYNDVKEILV